MADVSGHERTTPWIAFIAGGVAVLAVVLALFALTRGERLADTLGTALRDAPTLRRMPHLPGAPGLPAPPIPVPK